MTNYDLQAENSGCLLKSPLAGGEHIVAAQYRVTGHIFMSPGQCNAIHNNQNDQRCQTYAY